MFKAQNTRLKELKCCSILLALDELQLLYAQMTIQSLYFNFHDLVLKQIAKMPLISSLRNRLRYREVLRRTALPVPYPAYEKEIASQTFKVLFVSPFYCSFPTLVVSLLHQTYHNWELVLVHDGPALDLPPEVQLLLKDERIHFFETPERANDWGHTPRQFALEKVAEGINGDFIVMTNSDNYHVPGFAEQMLRAFTLSTQAVYCDMIHDYYHWRYFKTRLDYSFIDCACIMARRDAVLNVGWRLNNYEADWAFVCDLLGFYGKRAFRKVNLPLFVHN